MTQSILIVNDVATNRIVLNVRLSTARYTVVQANNGADALDVLREQKINMVLLDMDLPDMTGPELCTRIRRLPMGREIPLLISTETNDLRLKKAALAAGADDYLQRPVDEKLLLARVRSLFRARATKAELQLRDGTARALGFAEGVSTFEMPGHLGLIAEDAKKRAEIQHNLTHKSRHAITPLSRLEALGLASDEPVPDVFLVVADRDFHGASLSVLTELRSNPETRHSMVMMVLPGFAIDDSAIALDLGADDLVMDGFNPDELALRLNALVQRKRQNDALRARVKDGRRRPLLIHSQGSITGATRFPILHALPKRRLKPVNLLRLCCLIWITSNRSTIHTATPSVMTCCALWPNGCKITCAPLIWSRGSVAKSFWSPCRTVQKAKRSKQLTDCAKSSRQPRSACPNTASKCQSAPVSALQSEHLIASALIGYLSCCKAPMSRSIGRNPMGATKSC